MNRLRTLPAFAKRSRILVPSVCALIVSGACHAQNAAPLSDESIWLAVSNHTLDQLRGGFDVGGGLMVSFGISRALFINGQVVTSTSFQVGDTSKLTAVQTDVLSKQISSQVQAQVVQNGTGNSVNGAAVVPLAIYIQNTLNDQTIRNQTVIQATSNGLSLVKNLNLETTVNDALNNAVRNR